MKEVIVIIAFLTFTFGGVVGICTYSCKKKAEYLTANGIPMTTWEVLWIDPKVNIVDGIVEIE